MDAIFREEVASGDVIIYMDNILIVTTGNLTQHHDKVAQILRKLQDNDLFLKPEKCQIYKQEVEYLDIILAKDKSKWTQLKLKESWTGPSLLMSPSFTHS